MADPDTLEVRASIDGRVVANAHIEGAHVDRVLRDIDTMTTAEGMSRDDARQIVFDSLTAGFPAQLATAMLVWLACRGQAGIEAATLRQGGVLDCRFQGGQTVALYIALLPAEERKDTPSVH